MFFWHGDPLHILGWISSGLPPPMTPNKEGTIDGSPVEGTVVYPIILRVFFIHPRWLFGISSINILKRTFSPKTPVKVRSNMLHVPFRPVVGNFSDISDEKNMHAATPTFARAALVRPFLCHVSYVRL